MSPVPFTTAVCPSPVRRPLCCCSHLCVMQMALFRSACRLAGESTRAVGCHSSACAFAGKGFCWIILQRKPQLVTHSSSFQPLIHSPAVWVMLVESSALAALRECHLSCLFVVCLRDCCCSYGKLTVPANGINYVNLCNGENHVCAMTSWGTVDCFATPNAPCVVMPVCGSLIGSVLQLASASAATQ